MPFMTEPTAYDKTALSDLQGAWHILREAVVEHPPFTDQARLLFHIDEGMSWENVRNLRNMKNILLLIRNIVAQVDADPELREQTDLVRVALDEVFKALAEGDIR
ncbi:MAG: hypothetical protein ACP5FP_06190 [Desulfuromonadaceae bacterium]|jgi:hypothetical protein